MGAGSRTQSLSRNRSRMHNRRAEKIVEIVDGYDSVYSLSRALATMLLIHVPVGLGIALAGLLSTATSRGDTQDQITAAAFFAVYLETVLLWAVTLVWWIRVRGNVRNLGKSPRIGFWSMVKRQIFMTPLLIAVLFFAGAIPAARPLLLLIAAAILVYIQLFWPRVHYACMDMLWRTSSQPTGHEDGLPHFAPIWVSAFVLHQYLLVLPLALTDTMHQAIAMIVSGLLGAVAAFLAARLVVGVAERQDARLDALIANSGAELS